MATPLTLQAIRDGDICVGKNVNKLENQRLFETSVYTTVDEERQTLLFWTPELQCMKKDDNHLTILLPQTDESEEFYNTLMHIDDTVVKNATEKWNSWFPKEELSAEEVQEKFVSCIKAGSKEEQGRLMNVKTSHNIKCKVQGSDEITDDYSSLFDSKSRKGLGRVLVELKRVVFGRGNFKMEFVAHQLLLNAPEVKEPETKRFDNESWVDFQ